MAPVLRNGLVVVAACFSTTPALGLDLGGVQRKVIKIEPELDPESDKKFFGKDYPDDRRAPTIPHHKFSHPYPTVQDSERYDKDYVEDSNDDGGYWKAQMRYDVAKTKLVKAKEGLASALAKMNK